MSSELSVAIEAAKRGAQKALTYFDKNPKVTIKPDNTPVTQADKEAEQVIKEFLLTQDKNAQFIGEEGGGNLDTDEAWIIDPVDGTKDFMRGLPTWGVLLAHYKNGICDIGVCLLPSLNQLCYAQRGKGAFMHDKQIHVSGISKLSDAYLSHGEMRYFPKKESLISLTDTVLTERCHGDPSKYTNVAEGKADIVIDAKNHAWDSAPFSVIIEEAGGRVSNFKGETWSIHDLDFIATNGLLHDQVLEIVGSKR